MTLKDLEDMFGDWQTFSRQTSFGRTSWFAWRRKGYVPIKSQFELERITGGKLKANYDEARKDE